MEHSPNPPSFAVPPHVMMAGDSRDLPALRRILTQLPPDSYGQVFIEIVAEVQIVALSAPAGVTVTWLRRDSFGQGDSRRTFGSARGETIERAVLAWTSEWVEPGCQCGQSPFYVWVGCAMSPSVDRLHMVLRSMFAADSAQSADHQHRHGH